MRVEIGADAKLCSEWRLPTAEDLLNGHVRPSRAAYLIAEMIPLLALSAMLEPGKSGVLLAQLYAHKFLKGAPTICCSSASI